MGLWKLADLHGIVSKSVLRNQVWLATGSARTPSIGVDDMLPSLPIEIEMIHLNDAAA